MRRVYDVSKLDSKIFEDLKIAPIGKGRKREIPYLDAVAAFDIETTNLKEYQQAIMWVWQFQIGKTTIIGRTWDEFRQLVEMINETAKATLVIWVHNLAFEFQFLKSVIPVDMAFSLDERKILYFRSGKMEFRCSYQHSNMSLRRYLEKMGVESQKTELDYSVRRFPWTALSKEELTYCINDVKGLVEAISMEMKKDGDSLYTIPRTSTGYVRRPAKMSLSAYTQYLRKIFPDFETLLMLQRAFRGGNTHGSRFWAGKIVDGAAGYDIASSYPAQMLLQDFPGKFEDADPAHLGEYLKKEYCALFDIEIYDLKLKDPLWACPYVPIAKCSRLAGYRDDNGRVLSAKYLHMTLTEIDFSIILSEYTFKYRVLKLKVAKKMKLPIGYRRLVWNMFEQKTELKGIDDYAYQKFKNQVNALFGMLVQNPIKPVYFFNQESGQMELDPEKSTDALFQRYQLHGWLPYQYGVYVTAYARLQLERGLRIVKPEDFLYADTDSIKFKGDYSKAFERLNEELIDRRYIARDRKGNPHPIGIFEDDGHYKRFVHLGAKKYAYEDKEGLHITIAGVNKTTGPDELGRLENMKPGFVFSRSGGQIAYYNEKESLPADKLVFDGKEVELTTNIYLEDSTYTLSLAPNYDALIKWLSGHNIKNDIFHDFEQKGEK